MRFFTPLLAASLALCTHAQADTREYISVVGSSTVYPYATVVAERFGKGSFKTPKIESTGTGGGMKLFCSGVGTEHPDITNASRRIKASEVALCAEHGVNEIIEVNIGYDGIAVANSVDAPLMELELRDLFLALAKSVPNPDGSDTLVDNPYQTWQDIRAELPAQKIEVLGPPPTSGTRDAFVEIAMDGGCKTFDFIKEMEKKARKALCHAMREDGGYVEAGENDNLIVQKLNANHNALGIFGFSFLDQNSDIVQGSLIGGVEPTFESIADSSYPVSRPLFFYAKKAHIGAVPGIREFLKEFSSEKAMGEDGYLSDKGLVPLPEEEYETVLEDIENLKPLSL